jgi:YegS/Rv2252/BmrU family lipid kinase
LRIFCIINNNAGSAGKSPAPQIHELFNARGISPTIIEPQPGSDITELAKEAIKQKYDVIVAGGGDGTVNAVAAALIGNDDVKFGILPLGTLNHFARDAGIPTDISQAVDIIILGNAKSVDVGEVNGEIFLNNSSVGLYPAIVKLREGLQRSGYGKWSAATWATIRILSRFRTLYLELHPASGPVVKRSTAVLFVGNNAYETGLLEIGTRLELNQGRLWITMPTSSSRLGLLISLVSIILGYEKKDDVYKYEAANMTVNSNRQQLQIAIDGEVRHLKPPLKYQTLPKALRVIIPQVDGGAR